jgi:energy-coupling factor transporter ATP-binding protein EcfA2
MSHFQNQIVGIVGRKGSGKSTRAATLLKYAPRVFAWDPMADHRELLPDRFDRISPRLDDYFEEASSRSTFACAYTPGGDLEVEFEDICELVYDYGRMLFAVEEVPMVCRAGYISPTFGRIVRTGRHRELDLLWTAQRAGEVSRTLTSATDLWIFYSQTEPRDLDAISERCGREIAEKVAALGLHDSFCWDVVARKTIPNSPRLLKRESDFAAGDSADADLPGERADSKS